MKDVLYLWTFCGKNVLYRRMFCIGGRFVEGRFVTFVEGRLVEGRFERRTFCSEGRVVEGCFVPAPSAYCHNDYQKCQKCQDVKNLYLDYIVHKNTFGNFFMERT